MPFVLLFLIAGEVLAKEWPAETNVDPYKKWTIKFNGPVDPSTILSANVYVDGVITTVSPGADTNSIIVYPPTGGYKAGKTYSLHITNVKGAGGKLLKEANIKPFTIKDDDSLATFTVGSCYYTTHGVEKLMDTAPVSISGKVFVPVRFLGDALEIKDNNIIWDGVTQTITLLKDAKVIQLKIGSNALLINGVMIKMDASPFLSDDRAYLPIFWVGQAFGYNVQQNGSIVTIGTQDIIPPGTPTGLKVTAAKGSFILKWDPISDPDLFGYILRYRNNLNAPWLMATNSDLGGNVLFRESFTFIDVPDNETGYFYLTAIDKYGNESNASLIQSATTPMAATIIIRYAWKYYGDWEWDAFTIPETDYYNILNNYRHNKPHPLLYVYPNGTSPNATYYVNTYTLDRDGDPWISSVVTRLLSTCKDEGYIGSRAVDFVLSFVQYLPYTSDRVTTGFDDYPRYPLETLLEGSGDCEDTSLLAAVLLREMNYGVAIIFLPGHAALGVYGSNDLPGSYYLVNGKRYYYLETTAPGWRVGEIPDEYKGKSAFVIPLRNEVGTMMRVVGNNTETLVTVAEEDVANNTPINADNFIAVGNTVLDI